MYYTPAWHITHSKQGWSSLAVSRLLVYYVAALVCLTLEIVIHLEVVVRYRARATLFLFLSTRDVLITTELLERFQELQRSDKILHVL